MTAGMAPRGRSGLSSSAGYTVVTFMTSAGTDPHEHHRAGVPPERRPGETTWTGAGTWTAVAAGYLALALLNAWPIPLHFLTHLPHDLGDPVISTTILQWNATRPWFTGEWWNGVGYYPAADTLTWSDPRLGLTLIAGPVFWATGSMVGGYNTAYILSFALSALAAHLLVYTLTRSHAAALVSGCAYGFAPFRAAHLAHLELLASFWMPVALIALHRWRVAGSAWWLVAFAAAVVAQGLFCAYYVPMFGLIAGAWLLWFAADRGRPARLAGPVVAGLAAVALLMPLFLRYQAAHAQAGFRRTLLEIETYSADLNGLWSAPPQLWLWPSLPTRNPEGQIFPGLAIVAIVAWYLWRTRTRARAGDRIRLARRVLLAVAAAAALAGLAAAVFGPLRLEAGILTISVTELRKPLTLVLAAVAACLLLHPRVLEAARTHSAIAFYTLAAVLMFVLALGPNPTLYDMPFLYRAPYGWLMPLPGFESLRAPARFAMPAALMLAVAAGLAWHRLRPRGRHAPLATAALAALIVAEGWAAPIAAVAPHAGFDWPQACAGTPRLELPFGDIENGAAIQHRALLDGVRSVNGATGYVPPFAQALELASKTRDIPALAPIAAYGPLCVAVDGSHEDGPELADWVGSHPGVEPLEARAGRRFFRLPAGPAAPPLAADSLPIAAVGSRWGPIEADPLTDGDPTTAWISPRRQSRRASVTLALDCRADLSGIRLSQGGHVLGFPRKLEIQIARRRGPWRTIWEGPTLDLLVAGAMRDGRMAPISIPVEGEHANRVRLRLRQRDRARWAIAEIGVRGRCRGGGR